MTQIINQNTEWTTGSTHFLADLVQIAAGVTLTIDPGAVVSGGSMQVFGTLNAQGTAANKVQFENVNLNIAGTSASPATMSIDNSILQGGSFMEATGNATNGSFSLTNSTFKNVGNYAYVVYPTGDVVISDNLFDGFGGFEFGVSGTQQVTISHNTFLNINTTTFGRSGAVITSLVTYDNSKVIVDHNNFLDVGNPTLALELAGSMIAPNNYFGTTDLALINSSMIVDKNDDLNRPGYISITPILTSPDPTAPAAPIVFSGPRTLLWTGAPGTSVNTASNWNDVTNGANPAKSPPNGTDTTEFLGPGGMIAGSGTVAALQFGGPISWALASGSSLSATGAVIVGFGGVGALLVNNGASINGLGASDVISGSMGNNASVTVDGAGSAWKSSGELLVGTLGNGGLTISNASSATASGTAALPAAALGSAINSSGSLTVTGLGSRFTSMGELDVGQAGIGSLMISASGTVQTGGSASAPSQGFAIGQASTGSGGAIVTGVDSLLTNTGRFIVGDNGVGALSVNAGGTVITTPGIVDGLAGLLIANGGSASGSAVNVTGTGSNLQVAGSLTVGNAGFGQLSISQSATVSADSADAAAAAGGDGAITVTDTGSALNISGLLSVGDQSSGSLNIVNGASVTVGGLAIGTGASGSGNVVIGPGSHLTLTGISINVGLAGSAVLGIQGGTLGLASGTTLSPGIFGRIVQVGGLIDPATVFDAGGGSFGGGGTAEASGTIVNSSLASVTGGAETLLAPLITSSDPVNVAGIWSIKSGGTLVLDVNMFDNSQTIQFGDLTGVLTIGQQVTLDATQTPQTIAASALSGFAAPIVGYKTGDKITFTGLTVADDSVNGGVVTLFDAGHNTLGSLTFQNSKGAPDNVAATAAAAQIKCFAAGSRIETADGPRAVEDLRVGDLLVLADGGCEPIVWIGQRAVDCARHPKPEAVWPVRVAVGAFGDNVPIRDLYLSPDHAIYVNDVLVPVKLLVNGTSIAQVKRSKVTYYHVGLPAHAVILAEGLTVESYLDVGDPENFASGEVIRLHPDFTARLAPDAAMVWETRGAAPLVMTGPRLEEARRAVMEDASRVRFRSARPASQAG